MALKLIGAVALFQGLVSLILAIILGGQKEVVSLLYGSALSLFNFALLVYLWNLIFNSNKKRVALAVFLIVIKYAILVWVFVQIPKEKTIESFDFALGIIANPVSVIGVGFSYKFFRKRFFEVKK